MDHNFNNNNHTDTDKGKWRSRIPRRGRVQFPTGRGNPKINPNSNPKSNFNQIANPYSNFNPNSDPICSTDTNPYLNSNSSSNWYQNKNPNWNSSNNNAAFRPERNRFQGPSQHRQVDKSSGIYNLNSASSQSSHLHLNGNRDPGSGALYTGNHQQRPFRGRGTHTDFDRNNHHNSYRTGISSSQQNAANKGFGVSGNFERKSNVYNDKDNVSSNLKPKFTNKDSIDSANENKNNDRGNWPSNSGRNSTNKDLNGPFNNRKCPLKSIQYQRPEMKDLMCRSTRSSQDQSIHNPTSQVHSLPPLKQESEEVMHLERSNANVPNLVQEIEQRLQKGKAECMICYEAVGRNAEIWSCNTCYAIFHLHCIKTWASSSTYTVSSGIGQSCNWRCPGCQCVQSSRPEDLWYHCFCGKIKDPSVDFYLTPHCGDPCGKPLDKGTKFCPHTCTMQCHPGPCCPCTAMAPPQPCPCGKKTFTKKCSDQQSSDSCGQMCEKPLMCGRHFCDKICHTGPCDSCKIAINVSCFCGKHEDIIHCGDIKVQGKLEWKNGVYACKNLCMNVLSCQNHKCNLGCHPGECGECDLLPTKVKMCPCGKTRMLNQRKRCMDPVPSCSEVCEKLLPCGKHTCSGTCHQGTCPPCVVAVNQKCRCGSSSRTVTCWEITAFSENNKEFLCGKVCGQKKKCGRHRCSEKCCPLAHQGRLNIQSVQWDTHLCMLPCKKKLRCGQHLCKELCHSGHCPPCFETSFTDLCCACGKTSIPPPVSCGTPIPSCPYPCSIPQPCGHPATHKCHSGECPCCTVPIDKKCVGNHNILRNVQCGSRDTTCHQLCGRNRQCGIHACEKICHLPPCDSVSLKKSLSAVRISCGQTCGALCRDCKHTCSAPCHPSTPCPDTRCTFPVTISCSCGRLTAQVPCDVGGNNIRANPVFEASILHRLPAPLEPVESHLTRLPLGLRKLSCDDECAKLKKKRAVTNAFEISSTVDLQGLSGEMSEMLADIVKREPQWVLAVEERFKYLVLRRNKSKTNCVQAHVFSAVPKEKRDILRYLAERWNLSVYAAGLEPSTFLTVQATKKSRVPADNLLLKGTLQTTGQVQPPVFNSFLDMDPRLVLSFFDLPCEVDLNSLILKCGGGCELVWLSNKDAVVIFKDPLSAATALKCVNHASTYNGTVVVPQNSGFPSCSAWGKNEGMYRKQDHEVDDWEKAND